MEYSSIPNPNKEVSSHTSRTLTITASYYEVYFLLKVQFSLLKLSIKQQSSQVKVPNFSLAQSVLIKIFQV